MRSGSLEFKALDADVEVNFDQWAIPHIEAKSEKDAFFALGYVHAQDRLFQMDLLRRLAKGELSSILGAGDQGKFIKADQFFRTF